METQKRYYLVIENTQRNGVKGYWLVKVYQRWEAMEKWIIKQGKPVWIIYSRVAAAPAEWLTSGVVSPNNDFEASHWNSGSGFVVDTMPKMPYLGDKSHITKIRETQVDRYKLKWVNETGGDWLYPNREFVGLTSAKNAAHMAFVNQEIDKENIVQVFLVSIEDHPDPVQEYDRSDFDFDS